MAIRHHSFCELYKITLCQFWSLRIALKMCSHSNYWFQRCSLKNEVRGKGLKQLYPTKASFIVHLPCIHSLVNKMWGGKPIRKHCTVFVLLNDNTCFYLNQIFCKGLGESQDTFNVCSVVHHIPSENDHWSTVSAFYCPQQRPGGLRG